MFSLETQEVVMARTVIPKDNPARRNKHQELTLDRREDDTLIGPDLHWSVDWHPIVREWWDDWRRSEIAPMLEKSDWNFLQDTALLLHEVYNSTRASIAQKTAALGEIRQRVSKFGATYEDRLKLRIKFADASIREDKANPIVKNRVDYKGMMSDDS
jgi:hypothetical protein